MDAFWLLLLTLVSCPFLFILYLEVNNYKRKKILNRIPGPPTLPLLGNAHQFGRKPTEIFDKIFLWWNKYGKSNYRFWVGYLGTIMVTEAKDVEFILTSNKLLKKSKFYDILHPWLGLGLLTSSGTKWFKHRKMITPSFHFKVLQSFHEVMNANSAKFMEILRTISAGGEAIFDFQHITHYFTLDVICETAMGVSIDAMNNPDSEIVKAFRNMCYDVSLRVLDPLRRHNSLYRFFPAYSEYKRNLQLLQDFTFKVIKRRQRMLQEKQEKDAATNDDDLNAVIDAEYTSCSKQVFLDTLLTANDDGRPLTLAEIYEEVATFMFEGHDTTSSAVAFTVYMLSRHPRIQQKVFLEQLQIFGASNLARDASFAEISEMQYLDWVIKEALRLYPSVPIIGRVAERDFDMNGTLIPEGCSVELFLISLGYNERHFDDPYRCRPERFAMQQQHSSSPFNMVPFSAGPRNCIGQKFAMLELKTVISKIARTFEILPPLDDLVSRDGYVQHFPGLSPEELRMRPPPSKYDPILSAVLTLKSENGIMIRLRARN